MSTRGGGGKPTLGIVGAGRAGSALGVAFTEAGYRVVAVGSRTPSHAQRLARRLGAELVSIADVPAAVELTLLTVPDQAIAEVAATLSGGLAGRAVVHCSARLGPEVAVAAADAGATVGVMHPLQAMSGPESAPSLRRASFRVEAPQGLRQQLEGMVAALDGHVLVIPADRRDLYHAAAVMAGNAPLALLAQATALLEACGVPRAQAHEALAALLEGAAANARRQGAEQALTGPVVRGDTDAIAAHMRALDEFPDAQALYAQLIEEMEKLVAGAPAAGASRPSLHRVA